MRNCLILGSGRSGTSMVAGSIAKAGYFMGNNLHPGMKSNPKGFFEDREINSVNEDILAPLVPRRPPVLGRWICRARPIQWQRWLARVPLTANIQAPADIRSRIKVALEREPFCFKDPRFSFTLPVWRPFLRNTVFICVFRDPASTVHSILKECTSRSYLRNLSIDFDQALDVWALSYEHILESRVNESEWLFLHFDQVLEGDGLIRLESFTGAKADHSFPDPALRRSNSNISVTPSAWRTYQRLCELAGYNGG